MIAISEKLINNGLTNLPELKDISNESSNLSWKLICMKAFKISLESALLALQADSTNEFVYTNLPLAYIFNNGYEEASKIYMKYKGRVFKDENIFYRKVFLRDIETLENKGVTHRDFVRVKELLMN
jgi:hypothetical protein